MLGKYGGIAAGKLYMKYIGLDCGIFRLPIKNIDEKQRILFEQDVKALKLEDFFLS